MKQRIKAVARAAGSIIAVGSSAHQPRAEIQEYQQQTMNNINRQTQHWQPWISNPSAASVRGISSSSLMDESLHEYNTYLKSRFYAATYPESSQGSRVTRRLSHEQ